MGLGGGGMEGWAGEGRGGGKDGMQKRVSIKSHGKNFFGEYRKVYKCC